MGTKLALFVLLTPMVLAGCLGQAPSGEGLVGTRNQFGARDHESNGSAGLTDTILELNWTWANDRVHLGLTRIELTSGGTHHSCTVDGGEGCGIVQSGAIDAWWGIEESLLLVENGSNIIDESDDSGQTLGLHIWYEDVPVLGPEFVPVR